MESDPMSMYDNISIHYPTVVMETTAEQWATIQVGKNQRKYRRGAEVEGPAVFDPVLSGPPSCSYRPLLPARM